MQFALIMQFIINEKITCDSWPEVGKKIKKSSTEPWGTPSPNQFITNEWTISMENAEMKVISQQNAKAHIIYNNI